MDILLSVFSGLLTAIAFPTVFGGLRLPNLGCLAWVSLVPLFFAIKDAPPRRSFILTFISFAVCYGVSLSWLYTALNTYGHLSPTVSVLVLVLLIVILSAYIAFAPFLSSWVAYRLKISRFWTLPIFWTALEFARNYVPCNGFPWGNITNSQYAYLPVIQITDIVGIYGLVFLMVAFNFLVMMFMRAFMREGGRAGRRQRRAPRLFPRVEALFVLSLAVFTLAYGYYRVADVEQRQALWPSINVGMLQGNIPQEEKWERGEEERNLLPYINYTRTLAATGTDLIIWPEATYPWPIPLSMDRLPPETLGLENGRDGQFVLFGGITVASENGEREIFNSMLLADREGQILGRYNKAHLVPFGEYVPYKKLLFFAKKLVAPVGNFRAGSDIEPIYTDNYQIGGLVCYEDVFPEISRASVAKGANFLATITNDAWYGRSSAAFQHLAISVFRSVENKRWMVKSANSGISAVIDPVGRVISRTDIFEKGFIASNVRLGDGVTLYTRFGDWFAWGCVSLSVLMLLACATSKKLKVKS